MGQNSGAEKIPKDESLMADAFYRSALFSEIAEYSRFAANTLKANTHGLISDACHEVLFTKSSSNPIPTFGAVA